MHAPMYFTAARRTQIKNCQEPIVVDRVEDVKPRDVAQEPAAGLRRSITRRGTASREGTSGSRTQS